MNSFKYASLSIIILFCQIHGGESDNNFQTNALGWLDPRYTDELSMVLDSDGNNILHELASIEYPENDQTLKVAETLINDHPFIVNTTNHDKQTPLHEAAITGKSHLLTLLLKNDTSNINWQDLDGQTPLHRAVQNKDLSSVRVLLKHGAKPDLKNYYEKSSLTMAIEQTKKNNTDERISNLYGGADAGKGSWFISKAIVQLLSLYTPEKNLTQELEHAQNYKTSIPKNLDEQYDLCVIAPLQSAINCTSFNETQKSLNAIIKSGEIRRKAILKKSYYRGKEDKQQKEEHFLFEKARSIDPKEGKCNSFKTKEEYEARLSLLNSNPTSSLRLSSETELSSGRTSLRSSTSTTKSSPNRSLRSSSRNLRKSQNPLLGNPGNDDKNDSDYVPVQNSKKRKPSSSDQPLRRSKRRIGDN